ncbi:MAG TPA: MFS transporter [Candidatus Limnocylindria bacterium]|jgi:MFS family permease|nr:MFS transporter [Candidatus Limnocylindria bacterium]
MVAAAKGITTSSAYRGNIWRLFTVQALLMFILWVPIWVVFLQRKGLGLSQIGVLEGFAWVLTAALEVPSGAIADRFGRKASIAMGAFLYSVAMFLILSEALSPAFLLGYALWNSSTAFVSGADSALLYDSLKAGGRTSEAAKQTGRYTAIQQASQGIASVVGAAIATIDMTLCFTICGLGGLAATALVLTAKEPPRHADDGQSPLGYWNNLRTAIGIAARRPIVRALLVLNAAILVVPLVVYYVLLQPYAIGVGLPLASLGIVVLAVQISTVAASWLAHIVAGRWALTTIVPAGVAVILGATSVLAAVPSIPSIALMLAVALVPALVGPLLSARLNDLIPSGQRATILSLGALLFELGLAVGMPLLLAFAEALGAPAAIGVSAAFLALTVIPLLIVWRAAERRPVAATPAT